MKKILISIALVLGFVGVAYAVTKTPARDVTFDASTFGDTSKTDVQAALSYLNAQGHAGVNWGQIQGTLSSQADLNSALAGKQATLTTGTTSQYFKGNLSLGTFPTDLNSFTNGPGYLTAVNWGGIGGTLSNQSDLVSALALKQNSLTTGSTAQYFKGDLSLGTFPTNLNQFTNGPGYITGNQTVTLTGPVTGSGTTSIATALAALGVQSSNINWNNINGLAPLNSGGINWNNINAIGPINSSGINWTNFPASGFVKWNGQSAPTADTNTYLTGNQTITVSGDASGSGTTSIPLTIGALKVQSSNVNWSNINGLSPINTGGINWTDLVNGKMYGNGINWNDLNGLGKLNRGGINWQDLKNSQLNSAGINWNDINGLGPIKEGAVTFSDVTTGNASTSAHGFVPKGDGNSAHFLNGNLGYTTPAGSSYTASGTLLNLTGSAFSVKEGTLTDGKACKYVAGVGLQCDITPYTPAGVTPGTYDNVTVDANGLVTAGNNNLTTTSGINWTTVVNSEIQRAGINWSSLNSDVTARGVNWSTLSGNIQKEGINWTSFPASGFMKFNGSSSPSADASTYLTGNQSITLSGDVTGSGTTAITTALGSLKVQTANINWPSVNGVGSMMTGGINWTDLVNNKMFGNGINWNDVNGLAKINAGGVNWNDINSVAKINTGGINWTNMTTSNQNVNWGTGWEANATTINRQYDNGNSSTSKTIDFRNGLWQKLTLTGNCTITWSNNTTGSKMILVVIQGSGPYTITWPATVKWSGGTAITLTTTNTRADIVTFIADGTDEFAAIYNQNYTP